MNTPLHKEISLRLGRGCLFLIPFLLAFSASALTDVQAAGLKKVATVNYEPADLVIKGTVVDSKGAPVPGATVKVKSTGKSAATNANGDFTITAASGSDVLIISFIGYKTQEVAINNQTTIKITLEEVNSELNEVVVGLWYHKKTRPDGFCSIG